MCKDKGFKFEVSWATDKECNRIIKLAWDTRKMGKNLLETCNTPLEHVANIL
jgi:hypothetical protein